MNKLFFIWVVSKHTSEDMWDVFKGKLTDLLEWKAVVVQWRAMMIQLTTILDEIFYASGSCDSPNVVGQLPSVPTGGLPMRYVESAHRDPHQLTLVHILLVIQRYH